MRCHVYDPISDSVQVEISEPECSLWSEVAELASLTTWSQETGCPCCDSPLSDGVKTALVRQIRRVREAVRMRSAEHMLLTWERRYGWDVRLIGGSNLRIKIVMSFKDLWDLSEFIDGMLQYRYTFDEMRDPFYKMLQGQVGDAASWAYSRREAVPPIEMVERYLLPTQALRNTVQRVAARG